MRVLVFLLFTLLLSGSYAQKVTVKDIDSFNSYGQKKFHKAPKKVYIGSFKVFYQAYISDQHKHNKHHKSPAHEYEATLLGVDVEDFQMITDDLYAYFLDTLTQSGFQIIPFDSVKHLSYFNDWEVHSGGEITKSHIEGYLLSRPDGYTHFEHKDNQKLSFVDNWAHLSKSLDSAIVIDVEFVIPFVHTKHSKTGYGGHTIGDAHLEVNLAPEVGEHEANASGHSEVKIIFGNPYGVGAIGDIDYKLKHSIVLNDVLESTTLVPKEEGDAPKYYDLVFDTAQQLEDITHHAKTNAQQYKSHAVSVMKGFSRLALSELIVNANKNKK